MSRSIAEPKIRVGMQTDQATVRFLRIDDGYFLVTDGGPSTLRRGFTLTSPLAGAMVRFGVQVAAISDERSAEELAAKLRTDTGQDVKMVFDAETGMYKIIVGDFESSEAAEPYRGELTQRGYAKEMFIVRRPSEQTFEKVIELVDDEGDRHRITTASLLVVPATAESVQIGNSPYRGGARVWINSRGLFNVINELNLEDYLRGVVPGEMGPRIYDELEALKAQALAARTYAVRRLGEYLPEGYDICPTPACQVYKGRSAEEALTDEAIRQTAGLIITYEGQPIDALYTATCGGETSDVSTMFPGRSEPYLSRARCVEYEVVTLEGRADSEILSELQADARLFAQISRVTPPATWSGRDVAAAVHAAASVAGLEIDRAALPASSRRGDVLDYLSTLLRLEEFAEALLVPEDRQYHHPSSDWDGARLRAASFLVKFRIIPMQHLDRIDLEQPMPREELYALLMNWLRKTETIRETTGKIFAVNGRNLSLKAEGKVSQFDIPNAIPLFRKLGERLQEYASLPMMLGDRATLMQDRSGRIVAAIAHANYDGATFDRTSSFSSWIRSYRADELVPMIGRRNPIKELRDIRPLRVDESERVAELEVTAEGGRKFTLAGLPVRWSLGTPDNLFKYIKTKDQDGMDRYTFFGKGWGHGTGFCQVGAYGMAFRGWKAEQIIRNFYSGVEIVPMGK